MISTVTKRLLEATKDSYMDIKIAAIYALGESGNTQSEVIDELLVLSHDPYNEVKSAALKALGRVYRNHK